MSSDIPPLSPGELLLWLEPEEERALRAQLRLLDVSLEDLPRVRYGALWDTWVTVAAKRRMEEYRDRPWSRRRRLHEAAADVGLPASTLRSRLRRLQEVSRE